MEGALQLNIFHLKSHTLFGDKYFVYSRSLYGKPGQNERPPWLLQMKRAWALSRGDPAPCTPSFHFFLNSNGGSSWDGFCSDKQECKGQTTAERWKPPECLSVDEQIDQRWHIHSMEYYSTTKRNNALLRAATWRDLENGEGGQTRKATDGTIPSTKRQSHRDGEPQGLRGWGSGGTGSDG